MAGLGTQDVAQYMAANAIKRGDTNMGLGYMLGTMLANAWNRHDTKKQQKKMDAFLDNQKAPSVDMSGFIQDKVVPQEQYNALANGESVNSIAPAQPGISEAPAQSLTDQAISAIGGNGYREYVDQAPRVEKPFNPNRMKEFEQFARDNNLRDEVFKRGAERVKREQMEDAEALYLPRIRQNLYGYTDKDGFHAPTTDSRIKALNDLDELVKYSPDKANLYSKLGLAELGEGFKYDRNRAAAKEDRDAKFNQAVTVANIRGQYQNKNTNKTAKNYNGPKISLSDYNNASATMQEMLETYGKDKINSDPALKQRYMTNANIAYAYDQQMAANAGVDNYTSNTNNVQNTNPSKSSPDNLPAFTQRVIEGLGDDTGNWHKTLGKDGAVDQIINYMENTTKTNGKKYTKDEITDYLIGIFGQLPGWKGSNNGEKSYLDQLISSRGRKTDTEIALEKLKEKERLQKQLFPDEAVPGATTVANMLTNPAQYNLGLVNGEELARNYKLAQK